MLRNIFFGLMLTGCVGNKQVSGIPEMNMYDLSRQIGDQYIPSNSPCLDGLLANLGMACDGLVEIIGKGAVATIQCHEAKQKNSPWDEYTFFVIREADIGGPPNTHQFCIDLTTAIYIRERP